MLLRGEWAKLHQIWPGLLNTIGQFVAELSTIRSIFTARLLLGATLDRSFIIVGESDLHQIWREIVKSLALTVHLLDFI